MSELPEGWDTTTFGSICGNGQYGWTTKASSQGYVKYLRTTDITKSQIDWDSVPYCQETPNDLSKYQIQENDILISRAGSVGFSTLIGQILFPSVFASYLIRFIPSEAVDPYYVKYFLKSPEYWQQISEVSAGIALANVNAKKLTELSVPLPPLPEQHRIVAKLDSLFARSRRAREELERVPGLCDRYKQAVLAAACSGRLTADWRTEQCLEMDWQSTILGELIIDKPKNGYSAKPVNYETPFRVLSLTATTSGKFDSGHFKYFDESIDEESPFWLRPNDILVQRGNTIEYVGVSAIYDGLPKQFIFPDLMMRLRAQSCITTQFLHMVLSCEKSRKYLRSNATGTAGNMPKINQTTLIGLPVDLPSIEEQKEIVQRVEKLFKAIDSIAQDYQKARQLLDRLDQATLAKAFRGELVPQDPNDEPAAALLERIQAEPKGKAVKSKQKRGK
jgi:type I restriction enzyme, S subunit